MEEVYDRDNDNQLEQRIGRIVDQRMEHIMEQLTQRMMTLLGNQDRGRAPVGTTDDESTTEEDEYYEEIPQPRRRPQRGRDGDDRR